MIPYWLLFRLATRGLEVLERHKDKEPAIGIFVQSLGTSAPEFMALYDRSQALAAAQPGLIELRGDALGNLARKLRGWLGPLANDIPGFDPRQFGDKPNVPEDLINDARSVFTVLAEHAAAGRPVPFYTQTLTEDLEAAIEAALQEQSAATTAHAGLAELRVTVRAAAKRLQADLVAFRRTLRAHIGRSHPDYQRLRVSKGNGLIVDARDEAHEAPTLDQSNMSDLVEDLLDDGNEDDADDALAAAS